MKNKSLQRGFTLIELLAVLIVISVIIAITTYTVGGLLNSSRASLSSTQKKLIEKAAEDYYLEEGMNTNSTCVDLSYLISNGYLKSSSIKDPNDDSAMDGSVDINTTSNVYTYTYKNSKCE